MLRGGYRLIDAREESGWEPGDNAVHIFAAGAMVPEAVEASQALRDSGILASVFVVTSPDRLYRGLREPRSYLESLVGADEEDVPVVSVIDGHSHALSFIGSALGAPQIPLGVDHFGQSGARQDLYRHYGIDAGAHRARGTHTSCPCFMSGIASEHLNEEDRMDGRLSDLAARLDAGLIARREFIRKAAVITGGAAAGLKVLEGMARAQSPTKMRIWLFKSFVTAGNDILAKQIENWAAERKVQAEFDWATFGDREQKFVAAIEAGNPPDMAEMNYQGPTRYKPALRDVTKLAKDLANARGGLLPYAERILNNNGQYFGVGRLAFPPGFFVRKDLLDAKGVKIPKLYYP